MPGGCVLIDANRNSVVYDLFGVFYMKALVNNHLFFVHIKQILAGFIFN